MSILDKLWPRRALSPAELGRRGEDRAACFYRLRGWRVTGRNVRTKRGEIDLVVRRGRTLAFVEVKARSRSDYGEGHEAVDLTKRARMVAAAEVLLAREREPLSLRVRFDVVSLHWNGRRFELTHYADAFRTTGDEQRPWIKRVD